MPAENLSIELKITDRCNQQCFHCMNDDQPSAGRDLDCELFLRRLDEWASGRAQSAVNFTEVRMTGGEPLLNLPAVTIIGERCRRLQVPCGINTNATLLDEPALALLHATGLSTIKASFDSLDEDVWRAMRGSGLSPARTAGGIRRAVAAGFHVIVRFTLCAHNRSQLLPCYRAARDWGVHKFQVKPMIPAGRAAGADSFLDIPELRRAIQELSEIVSGPAAAPEILCWPPDYAAGLAARPCGNMTKMYIGTDGSVFDCNYLSDPPFASLREQSLEEACRHRHRRTETTTGGHCVLAGCPAWSSCW
ncbi:MAG: radical SAM protein [Verrucomicrobia bacterium]|nr:radical SAM protein [Verrucomicrobiota bacterium]